jgi:hypothetical protein
MTRPSRSIAIMAIIVPFIGCGGGDEGPQVLKVTGGSGVKATQPSTTANSKTTPSDKGLGVSSADAPQSTSEN